MKITDISNIHEIVSEGRFRITWREDGHFRSLSSTDRDKIEKHQISLLVKSGEQVGQVDQVSIGLLKPMDKADPGPKMFKKLTADIIDASHKAVNEGNMAALKRLKEFSGIVSTLSKSYQPWSETQKTIEEFEKLIEYHESTDKTSLREGTIANQSATRSCITETLETDTGSEQEVFPSSDKV